MSVNSFRLNFKIIFFDVNPIVFKDYWKEKTEKYCKNLNVVTSFIKMIFICYIRFFAVPTSFLDKLCLT